jgi:hypothetical protein
MSACRLRDSWDTSHRILYHSFTRGMRAAFQLSVVFSSCIVRCKRAFVLPFQKVKHHHMILRYTISRISAQCRQEPRTVHRYAEATPSPRTEATATKDAITRFMPTGTTS